MPRESIQTLSMITHNKTCLVPRRLSFDENVRAKEGGKETTEETAVPFPLRFITCHSFCARLCHAKNEAPEEEAGAPAFKTIFNKEFGLVGNQHQFLSRRINFIPRTYIVRPKTCYCQKQSTQDPIFPSHARDQSFTRVARN